MYELVEKLDREINTNELLGRRFFILINKAFPKVMPAIDVIDWSDYPINLINNYTFTNIEIPNITWNMTENILHVKFTLEVTPLQAREFTVEILNQMKEQND